MANPREKLSLEPVQPLEHREVGHRGLLSLVYEASPPAVCEQNDRKHRCIEQRQARNKEDVQLV